MVGKTVIISEKVSSSYYATTNPGGAISLVSANSYTRTASVASGQSAMGTLAWSATAYSEYTTGGDYIIGVAGTVTATPAVGYVFDEWSGDTTASGVTISGNTATIAKNAAAQDIALVANFRKKTASDKYNVYLRWKSTYSVSEGAQEVERTFRVVKGDAAGSKTLRVFKSDATTALSAVAPNSGVAIERGNETSGSSTWYRANYFPLSDDGDYWVGRNVGAMRSGDEQLVGWELRGSSSQEEPYATLPADGSTTIAQIAAIFDDDEDLPFGNNSDGDYRVAYLEAVWGNPRTITVSTTGTNDETPTVSATPNPALENDTVTLTAQVDDLATCEFSEWSVTDGEGDPVQVTEGSDEGVATFTMPDSNVMAVAEYTPVVFTVQVGSATGGTASYSGKSPSDTEWVTPAPGATVYGYQVKFSATPSTGYRFGGWYKDGVSTPYSLDQNYIENLTGNLKLTPSFVAESQDTKTVTASANYAGRGRVLVNGGTNAVQTTDGSVAYADFSVGQTVTLVASFEQDYVFDGWYANGTKKSEAVSCSFVLALDSPIEYEARFGVSDDAIYEWEGSAENKEIEWTSKVYTAPRPFDPVAARVDAAGYPVDLTVRTYSSPDVADALPVRDHELTGTTHMQSQDGRRLPRMRPERYVRFTVKSMHEIDTVAIGTNMAEVN